MIDPDLVRDVENVPDDVIPYESWHQLVLLDPIARAGLAQDLYDTGVRPLPNPNVGVLTDAVSVDAALAWNPWRLIPWLNGRRGHA